MREARERGARTGVRVDARIGVLWLKSAAARADIRSRQSLSALAAQGGPAAPKRAAGLFLCAILAAMRIIDVHTHIWPDALASHAVSSVGAQGHIAPHYDGTAAGLRASMDRAGIDLSVVLPVATKASQVRTINDFSASLVSDPRIVPFGAMHPDLEEPAAELARIKELGIRGFKMHPEYQTFELDEPRMTPIYEAAIELGLTIFFHSGGDVAFTSVRGTPEAFVELIERYPGLHAVLAHMGGFRQWHAVTGRLAGRDVLFDTAYTLGHLSDDEFVSLVREHGVDRVMFGTDGPWTDPDTQLAHLRRLPFAPAELNAILGGNAERFLSR